MLLFNAFISLNLYRPNASLAPEALEKLTTSLFTQADLNGALEKQTQAFRLFVLEHREIAPGLLKASYETFLEQCKFNLGKQAEAPLLPVVLDSLDKPEHKAQTFQLMEHALAHQQNAVALAPLGRQFIDNPNAFFALLKWLSTKGVSPREILQTGIVQDYVRYYLTTLESESNPITVLHQTLSADEVTAPLAQAMHVTRCKEGELSAYALDGTTQSPDALDKVDEAPPPPFLITRTPENLEALTRLFGVRFLMHALSANSDISGLLNHSPIGALYLPELLKHVQAYPPLKPRLAGMLLPETFDRLLEQHTSGLFSLIPFSNHLKTQVRLVPIEFETIEQNATSAVELVSDLSPLLSVFNSRQDARGQLIFERLVEAVISEPFLLEDEHLLSQLRRFKPCEEQLVQRVHELEAQFEAVINEISIDSFDNIDAEDLWKNLIQRLHAIQSILPIPSTFPNDKYKFQARTAYTLVQNSPQSLNLDELIRALNVAPAIEENNITPYERLLVELFVTIDNKILREQIAMILDAEVPKERNWRETHYSGASLTMHAVNHGNLGLLQWLEVSKLYRPQKITNNTFSITSAQLGHWHIVDYFHERYRLNQSTVSLCLHHAVNQAASHVIPHLWKPNRHTPQREHVESTFLSAIRTDNFSTVNALLLSPTKPCDTVLTKGFKQSLHEKQYAIATQIAALAEDSPCLGRAIHQTLLDAARHNKLGIILCFRHLKEGIITQVMLDAALIYATRAGHLSAAQSLCKFDNLKPRESARVEALRHAEKKQLPELMGFLSDAEVLTTKPTKRKKRKLKRNATQRELFSPSPVFFRTASCLTLTCEEAQGTKSPLLACSFLSGERREEEAVQRPTFARQRSA